jgi:hypothetical protein
MTRPSSPFSSDGGIHEIPLTPLGPIAPLGPLAPITGRLWLCGKHKIAPDPDAVLDAVGADTVVCLTQPHELDERYPQYVSWLRARVASGTAVWFPIHDLGVAEQNAYERLVDDLVDRLRAGSGIVVHCAAGIGRAGTTAVAIAVRLGMPLDEALAHVRAHRPMAGPEVGAQLDLVRSIAQR